jgi:galactonate dehydratase
VRVYAHAGTVERAEELVGRGYTALKAGGLREPVATIDRLRRALGDEIDLCIDVHGPPWYSVPDAIRVGQALGDYDLLFYEDPVPPENIDAIARVAASIDVPLACGERSATVYGFRELIEREIADVIQPDMGRAGGFSQMKKIAGHAESHHIMLAPHDGSNGPIAEAAALHLLAAIPNCLILEHLADDVPWRYEVATNVAVVDSHIAVPTAPGLGVTLDEAACAAHPGRGNVANPSPEVLEATYVQSRPRRGRLWRGADGP